MATDQAVCSEDETLQETEDADKETSSDNKIPNDKTSRKKLSMDSREKIRALLQEGLTQRQIAKHMNVSSSVIWRFEKRLKETGGVEDRHKGRRPKKIRDPTEHWIEIGGERKYQCTHCQKTFVHFSQIHEHVRVHTGERPFKCDQCFKGFAQSSALKRHLICHSDERPFMCDFCAKCFADPASLRLHVRTHTGEKPYKCRFCDRRCTTAGNLNAHMRVHRDQYDNESRTHIRMTEGNLTQIKMAERKEVMFDNEWGMKQGRDEDSMANEEDAVGSEDEGIDDEDEGMNACVGRKEGVISALREEDGMDSVGREEEGTAAHVGREEGMHNSGYEMASTGINEGSQQYLGKERETVSMMREDGCPIKQEPQEMSTDHSMSEDEGHEVLLKEPEVTFSVLPEPSKTPGVKASRRRLSMDDREKVRALLQNGTSRQQISRIMDVSFSVIWRFEKRLRDTGSVKDRHKGGRPKAVYEPSEHWTEIEGERKFQCNHCRKTFVHFAQIHEHIRVHTGERPFKCDQCFKEFAQSSSLKRHLICHSDERPFMCDFCAKCFADPASLRLHVRTHTGEKPYKCRFCDRRCTTAGNLNAHTRVHRDQINEENMARMIMAQMMMTEESVAKMDEVKASAADDDEVKQEDGKEEGRKEVDLVSEDENRCPEEGGRGTADESMGKEEHVGKGESFCNETGSESCESDIEVEDRTQSRVKGQGIDGEASVVEIKQEPPDSECVTEQYSHDHLVATEEPEQPTDQIPVLRPQATAHLVQYINPKRMPSQKTIKHTSSPKNETCSDEARIPSPETEKPIEKKCRRRMSVENREKIKALLHDGTSRRQISKIMNVAPSVISRFAIRLKETGGIEDRHKIGRPKKYHDPTEHWTDIGGERKYQCKHCQKTFVHFVQIQEHIRVHTGEKPFKCDQCFRGFARSSTLKRHLICHSNERLYMCDFCAKCFAEASSLRVHVRTHTGEKPYRCRFCDKGCTTGGNLNAHMRVHRDKINKQRGIRIKKPEETIIRRKIIENKETRIKEAEENMTHIDISEMIEKAIRQEEQEKKGHVTKEEDVNTGEERRDDAEDCHGSAEVQRERNSCERKMVDTCAENTQQESYPEDVYQVEIKQEPENTMEECKYLQTPRVKQPADPLLQTGFKETIHGWLLQTDCRPPASNKLQNPASNRLQADYTLMAFANSNEVASACGTIINEHGGQHSPTQSSMPPAQNHCRSVGGQVPAVYRMPSHKTVKHTSSPKNETCRDETRTPSPETDEPIEKKHLKRLSIEKREKVKALLQDGTSRRQISKIMNVAPSTISRFAIRLKETGGIKDRHKTGRPKKYHDPTEHWTDIGGERKYQCKHCQKAFEHFVQIQEHIRVHTGEKPFKCDQCFRGFARSGTLKRHLICHSNERLYMCDFCAKCFAEASSLKVHVRTHTGEKPYRCRFCDKGCTSAGNLNAHMRVHRDKINGRSGIRIKKSEETINQSTILEENVTRIKEAEENMAHIDISEKIEKAKRQEEQEKKGHVTKEEDVNTGEERRDDEEDCHGSAEVQRDMNSCERKMVDTCAENTQQESYPGDVYQVEIKQEPEDTMEECQ
ncbi:zinc finger protein 91-like [Haliotis rufescens]|uniref:zinc finger protein 91-like n=1 Tax=Haliotis rufescens TaxID=6454 RepID=UPI00201E94C4|nr:zinc finger protein 91-like [Haliotis rufescens]